MNGRIYSPSLGRMLSPDPVTQAPEDGQNYNRFIYAFNNPLKYDDPSGYSNRRVQCAERHKCSPWASLAWSGGSRGFQAPSSVIWVNPPSTGSGGDRSSAENSAFMPPVTVEGDLTDDDFQVVMNLPPVDLDTDLAEGGVDINFATPQSFHYELDAKFMANDVPISIGLGSMVSNSAGNSYFGDVSTGADLLWGAPESMARQLELQVLSPIAATGCVAAPAICAGAARGVAVGALLNPNTSAKGHLINGSVGAVIGPLGSAYTRAGGNGAVLRTVNEVKFEVLGWGLGKAASGL